MSKTRRAKPNSETGSNVAELPEPRIPDVLQGTVTHLEESRLLELLEISHRGAGRSEAAVYLTQSMQAARALQMQRMKDSPQRWKGLLYPHKGGYRRLADWKDLCECVFLCSRSTADELLQNLSRFGQELYSTLQTIGLGTAEMRQLRGAETESLAAIRSAAEAGRADEVQELAEKLVAERNEEKRLREHSHSKHQADLEAKQRVISGKSKKIDELTEEIEQLRGAPVDQEATAFAKLNDLALHMRLEIIKAANCIQAVQDAQGASETLVGHAQKTADEIGRSLIELFAERHIGLSDYVKTHLPQR